MKTKFIKLNRLKSVLAGALLILSLGARAQTNVFDDVIDGSPVHTSLRTALIQEGLDVVLRDPTATYTVFAPDDNAFDDIATALGTNLAGVLALPNLSQLLQYHVLGIEVGAGDISNGLIETPLFPGNTLKFTLTSTSDVFVNHAQVTGADNFTDNGVVHVIDAVLLPSTTVVDIAINNGFTSLTEAVITAELVPTLSNPGATFTVFAPTNDAFDRLADELGTDLNGILALPNLADVLTYHVLGSEVLAADINNGDIAQPVSLSNSLKLTVKANSDVFVNHALISGVDITADNGVVHIIEDVVLPNYTVVDVALDNSFTSLTQAVITAELLPALTNPFESYTVFAPTNAAFDNLATALGTDLNGILALDNLASILLYHVVGGELESTELTNGRITALNNGLLTIDLTGGVFVNNAEVVTPDINADNGIVHVLDAVIETNVFDFIIAASADHTTLRTALEQEGLDDVLRDMSADYTVFAPTNDAFDDLAAVLGTNIAGILALPNLSDVLTYHVIGSEVVAADITNGMIEDAVSTTNTLKFTVKSSGDVFVNQAQVTAVDIMSLNGYVHVIDAVVLPNETVVDIAIDNGFTSLTAAVVEAELLPTLVDPFATFTVFAPTDAAFDDLATALGTNLAGVLALPNLSDVLTYHVLGSEVLAADINNGDIVQPVSTSNTLKLTVKANDDVFVNQAQVTGTDIGADNGVVHILNAVVLPINTVVDVAIDNGFTSLTAAVVQAELLPALSDPFSEFTVFAPTDAAFTTLATDLGTNLNGILALPNLEDILLYHVVSGTVLSTDLVTGPVTALNNGILNVDISSGVKINDSNVTLADVDADNGVVHVIDAVLLESTASIAEQQGVLPILMYPNPASDVIKIDNIENGTFVIMNMYGAIVMEGNAQEVISISNLTNGTYIMSITNETSIYQGRFVKM